MHSASHGHRGFPFGRLAIPSFVRCLTVSLCARTDAQNLLKKGDFKRPLGPTNWTVIYLHCGPDDWEIKDRSRGGSRRAAWYGGYFRVLGQKLAHACFAQTVSKLTVGHIYNFVGFLKENWWKGVGDPKRDRHLVYMELIGGHGSPVASCGIPQFSVCWPQTT